jgi:hypothetical protein
MLVWIWKLAASLIAACSLATCAPASAASVDEEFLGALRRGGVDYASPGIAVAYAHLVCAKLDDGMSRYEVAMQLMESTNLSGYLAGYFVGGSIAAYCPQHGGKA